jgi:oligopeptide/dipeptide ABC transporter ATP-binding protein
MNESTVPVFSVLDVEKRFLLRKGRSGPVELRALDSVRLDIEAGSSVALVGESGSGKSTLVRMLLGLDSPGEGRVLYDGMDLQQVLARDRARFAREVAFVYQDARGSMNPRFTIGEIIGEPMRVHRLHPAQDIPRRVASLLERVGLPASAAVRYPHQLSGGQVRRVAVARALAQEPRVIMADEAVAGLDVSVQASLLNLLRELVAELKVTLVFVTHDLGVASYLCDRIAVMYLGRILETGPVDAILQGPAHPYTRGLLESFPRFDRALRAPLRGEIPSPVDLPAGCRFAGRCPCVQPQCTAADPVARALDGARLVACLYPLSGDAAPA